MFKVGRDNFCMAHVGMVPVMGATGEQKTKPCQHSAIGDFKDTLYPLLESDTLFLEGCVCVVFSGLASSSNRGMSKPYPLMYIYVYIYIYTYTYTIYYTYTYVYIYIYV